MADAGPPGQPYESSEPSRGSEDEAAEPSVKPSGLARPEDLLRRAERLEQKLRKPGEADSRMTLNRSKWLSLIGLTGVIVVPAAVLGVSHDGWFLVPAAAAIAVNALVFGITRATDRFGWYAIAIFLSVAVLGAIVGIVRTGKTAKVQPVAVIRKGDDVALCGVFIAENDKRLYVGRLRRKPPMNGLPAVPANIFSIPASDIDMVKLGRLTNQRRLTADTRALASQLYADRAEQHPDALKARSTLETAPGKGGASTQVTTESPPARQHPALKGHPPAVQLCTIRGGPTRPVPYDP